MAEGRLPVCLFRPIAKQKINRQTLLSLEELDETTLPPVYDSVSREEVQELVGIDDPSDAELLYRIFVLQESYEAVAQSLGVTVWACYKRAERLRKRIQKNYRK